MEMMDETSRRDRAARRHAVDDNPSPTTRSSAAPPFPAVPLVVLTHGIAFGPPPLERAWQELQAS
jgi:hypothetical protein